MTTHDTIRWVQYQSVGALKDIQSKEHLYEGKIGQATFLVCGLVKVFQNPITVTIKSIERSNINTAFIPELCVVCLRGLNKK